MKEMSPCVYILTNDSGSVLYTGVTSDIDKRIVEHRTGVRWGFTSSYHLRKVVFVECHPTMMSAIEREKQIKSWSRSRKVSLISSVNPSWSELMPIDEF